MAKGKHPAQRRYTAADKAAAIEVLKVDGLAAAARASGATKSSVQRWARDAGLDPTDYAHRSTAQNVAAAAASVAARRAKITENRASLSDTLLENLGPKAAAILSGRLDEDAELTARLEDATEKLEFAIIALEACGTPPAKADKDELKRYAEARKQAVAAVKDAMLVRRAWSDARIDIRSLVGILTRAIGDHLNLEGDAGELAAAGSFTLIFTAPRPTPGALPDVVDLPPEAIRNQ